MSLTDEQKERKKELAKYKRKVVELAGVMHDIVEDTIWTEYDKLAGISAQIETAMVDVIEFKEAHPYLK